MVTEWTQGAETNFLVTSLEKAVSWGRKYSLWPYPFGSACCAVEFMAVRSSDYDLSRFGAELVRFSPRQADLLLILGPITCKQAPIIRQIYEQMPDPKWVIAVGACASSGGSYRNYNTIQGADAVVPVDVYVPGCPPRPEAIMESILRLHQRISEEGFDRDHGHVQGNKYTHKETEEFGDLARQVAEANAAKARGQAATGDDVPSKRQLTE